jgi:hypothetical protein
LGFAQARIKQVSAWSRLFALVAIALLVGRQSGESAVVAARCARVGLAAAGGVAPAWPL